MTKPATDPRCDLRPDKPNRFVTTIHAAASIWFSVRAEIHFHCAACNIYITVPWDRTTEPAREVIKTMRDHHAAWRRLEDDPALRDAQYEAWLAGLGASRFPLDDERGRGLWYRSPGEALSYPPMEPVAAVWGLPHPAKTRRMPWRRFVAEQRRRMALRNGGAL